MATPVRQQRKDVLNTPAAQRAAFLWKAANALLLNAAAVANNLSVQLRQVCQSQSTPLPKGADLHSCARCETVLLPPVNCKILSGRPRKSPDNRAVLYACSNCGHKGAIPGESRAAERSAKAEQAARKQIEQLASEPTAVLEGPKKKRSKGSWTDLRTLAQGSPSKMESNGEMEKSNPLLSVFDGLLTQRRTETPPLEVPLPDSSKAPPTIAQAGVSMPAVKVTPQKQKRASLKGSGRSVLGASMGAKAFQGERKAAEKPGVEQELPTLRDANAADVANDSETKDEEAIKNMQETEGGKDAIVVLSSEGSPVHKEEAEGEQKQREGEAILVNEKVTEAQALIEAAATLPQNETPADAKPGDSNAPKVTETESLSETESTRKLRRSARKGGLLEGSEATPQKEGSDTPLRRSLRSAKNGGAVPAETVTPLRRSTRRAGSIERASSEPRSAPPLMRNRQRGASRERSAEPAGDSLLKEGEREESDVRRKLGVIAELSPIQSLPRGVPELSGLASQDTYMTATQESMEPGTESQAEATPPEGERKLLSQMVEDKPLDAGNETPSKVQNVLSSMIDEPMLIDEPAADLTGTKNEEAKGADDEKKEAKTNGLQRDVVAMCGGATPLEVKVTNVVSTVIEELNEDIKGQENEVKERVKDAGMAEQGGAEKMEHDLGEALKTVAEVVKQAESMETEEENTKGAAEHTIAFPAAKRSAFPAPMLIVPLSEEAMQNGHPLEREEGPVEQSEAALPEYKSAEPQPEQGPQGSVDFAFEMGGQFAPEMDTPLAVYKQPSEELSGARLHQQTSEEWLVTSPLSGLGIEGSLPPTPTPGWPSNVSLLDDDVRKSQPSEDGVRKSQPSEDDDTEKEADDVINGGRRVEMEGVSGEGSLSDWEMRTETEKGSKEQERALESTPSDDREDSDGDPLATALAMIMFEQEEKKRLEEQLLEMQREKSMLEHRLGEQTKEANAREEGAQDLTLRLEKRARDFREQLENQARALEEQSEDRTRGFNEQARAFAEQLEERTRGFEEEARALEEQLANQESARDEMQARLDEAKAEKETLVQQLEEQRMLKLEAYNTAWQLAVEKFHQEALEKYEKMRDDLEDRVEELSRSRGQAYATIAAQQRTIGALLERLQAEKAARKRKADGTESQASKKRKISEEIEGKPSKEGKFSEETEGKASKKRKVKAEESKLSDGIPKPAKLGGAADVVTLRQGVPKAAKLRGRSAVKATDGIPLPRRQKRRKASPEWKIDIDLMTSSSEEDEGGKRKRKVREPKLESVEDVSFRLPRYPRSQPRLDPRIAFFKYGRHWRTFWKMGRPVPPSYEYEE